MSDLHHYTALKLIAEDTAHFLPFSTHLQDGLMPITSMTFDPDAGLFTCLVNRFCWEMCDHFDHHKSYFRVHSGLTIRHATHVYKRNFHQKHPERIVNLLTITAAQNENGYSIRLLFSGDREIDIQVSKIECLLRDFHHPWPTATKPQHWHEHVDELNKTASRGV